MSAEIIESLRYMQFDVAPYNSVVIDSAIELIKQQQARIAELEAQAAIGRRAVAGLRQYGRYVGLAGIERCVECDSATECDPDCELAAILRDARLAGMGVES